jgi:hypothetical protein
MCTMGDCDFCIYYSFPYSGIRTRVISGFGGMQLKIEMNLKNKGSLKG